MARTKVQTRMIDYAGTQIDRRKNFFTNPAMQVNMENPATSGTTNGFYAAESWLMFHSQDGTLTAQQVASGTPEGSPNRFRITVTSPDTSIAAGQYAGISQRIEGYRFASAQFGTSRARQLVLRFGWKSPAGTYTVAFVNKAFDRSYVREFTISGGEANTDTVQTLTCPGDTSGTWAYDATAGLKVYFTIACGSTYQTTADAWQAGGYFGTASSSNGIGTGSSVFELFDTGLYEDRDEIGTAPPYVLNDYGFDLFECLRYAEIGDIGNHYGDGASHTVIHQKYPFQVAKRAAPTVSRVGTWRYWSTGSATSFTPISQPADIYKFYVEAGSLTTGRGFVDGTWFADARVPNS